MTSAHYIGVDLGGTQLRLAAVTAAGTLATDLLSVPTGKNFGPDDLLREFGHLHARVAELTDGYPPAGWGVGVAGIVWQGALSQSDNLPLLNGIDLNDLLRAATQGMPFEVENDARCFVLAEARFGAGRGAQHVCGITLGTGLGGGVIANGQLVRGARGGAGEIWSIPLREHFFEYYLSGAGLMRGYETHGGAPDLTLTPAEIAERARQGETAAQAAWLDYGTDVTRLCQTMQALLDPEVIVIGGSMALAHDLFGAAFQQLLTQAPVRLAELGAAAGVIGAAALLS